jgi:radical SAM protein with 4Fe4S-binding SPASM domain
VVAPQDMESVLLVVTAQCNSHCSYCYQTAKKPLSMDLETMGASIDLALNSASSETTVMFLGGEPLLEWPKIRQAVEYACRKTPADKRVKYALSTNGLLVTDEVAGFLDDHDFDLQLSFDGIAKAQAYRRKGTFATIDRLLSMLREQRPALFRYRLRVCTTQIPATIPYFADSFAYLLKKNVRQIGVSPSLTPSQGWVKQHIKELDTHFSRIYDNSLRHFQKTGDIPLLLFRKSETKGDQPVPSRRMCGVVNGKTLVVDVDGQVYGCVMFAESYQEFRSEYLKTRLADLRMGDLRDPGFWDRYAAFPKAVRKVEIFHHKEKKYSSYRKCGDCEYLDSCSVCPVSIFYDPTNSDPNRVPDFICAFNMIALKYRDRFPAMPDPFEQLESFRRRIFRQARPDGR